MLKFIVYQKVSAEMTEEMPSDISYSITTNGKAPIQSKSLTEQIIRSD